VEYAAAKFGQPMKVSISEPNVSNASISPLCQIVGSLRTGLSNQSHRTRRCRLVTDVAPIHRIALASFPQKAHLSLEILAAFANGKVHFQMHFLCQREFSILRFG
jgi:hypothetical protein